MDVGRTGGHCPRVNEIAIIVKTLLGSTIPGTQLTLNTGAASKFVKDIVGVLTWVPILASKSKNGPRSGTKKALPGSTIQG